MDLSNLLKCPVCFEDFDCDVTSFSTEEERRSSRLPVLSHQCSHKICASCLNNWQLVEISIQKSIKAKAPKWFKCHSCKEKTAFNAEKMKVDLYACGAIASLKAGGSTSSEPQSIVTLKNNKPESDKETDLEGKAFANMELILEAGAARRRMPQFDPSSEWKHGSDNNIQRLAMTPSITSHVDRKRKFLERALEEGKSAGRLQVAIDRDEEMQSVEEFLGNSASRRNSHLHCKQREKKQKETKENGKETNAAAAVPNRSICIFDLSKRLAQVGVGSRVAIYWPLENTHYPATIIVKHERWPHTYKFLYDDGEKESFDLSEHQQFQILDDAVPKAALDSIAAYNPPQNYLSCLPKSHAAASNTPKNCRFSAEQERRQLNDPWLAVTPGVKAVNVAAVRKPPRFRGEVKACKSSKQTAPKPPPLRKQRIPPMYRDPKKTYYYNRTVKPKKKTDSSAAYYFVLNFDENTQKIQLIPLEIRGTFIGRREGRPKWKATVLPRPEPIPGVSANELGNRYLASMGVFTANAEDYVVVESDSVHKCVGVREDSWDIFG